MDLKRIEYTQTQLSIIEGPLRGKVFLEGPAGAGKTTAGVARALNFIERGVPAASILVLVPQRTLARAYYDALRRPDLAPGGFVTVLTVAGLARRMVDLFWPIVAEAAGFAHPDEPPSFLTLETAQYYMAQLVGPLLDQGYFEAVTIDRNRLYSQILDNLNKSAVVGFPIGEIAERLKGAWVGEASQRGVYDQAQECAERFRRKCFENNLLDFSLQLEVFREHLWPLPLCRGYLLRRFRHLIVDNLEEDTPVSHDILASWLSEVDSALLIYDLGAGYRRFLGADPEGAYALKGRCDESVALEGSFVTSTDLEALASSLAVSLGWQVEPGEGDPLGALKFEAHRFHPQMLDWVADQIAALVHDEGVQPGQVVVLAPFMTDALRFALQNRLGRREVPSRSHRPSRALREEPATRCLLTLAALAHPDWGLLPTSYDMAYALTLAIDELDLVRAHLLSKVLYRPREDPPAMLPFDGLQADMQSRITFTLGERYERLRAWIEAARGEPESALDYFLSRLFGEVLSQPGFGFHRQFDAARVAGNLVESARKFRWVVEGELSARGASVGREYMRMVQDGVVAAQYVTQWELDAAPAVLLAPAYTFLMVNRPADYQFWLDIGGSGWWERLYQPLTHPYVLSRSWPIGAPWTDAEETSTQREVLHAITQGLIRRCRKGIFLGLSDLGESGYEQRGPLLQAFHRALLAAMQTSVENRPSGPSVEPGDV